MDGAPRPPHVPPVRTAGRSCPAGAIAAIYLLSTALAAGVICESVLHRRNTLHNNGAWLSSKVELDKGVIGAVAYVLTRPALAMNVLNLGAWLGHQEVLFRQKVSPRRVEFDFRLEDDAYLVFVFNKHANGYAGFRFSRNARFESISFSATVGGRFLDRQSLEPGVLDDGWQHAVVEFGEKDVTLGVDGATAGRWEGTVAHEQQVGFRAGGIPACVDNVEIDSGDLLGIFRETFAGRHGWPKVLLAVALGLILLHGLLLAFVVARRGGAIAPRIIYLATLNASIFVGGGLYYLTDFFVLSQRYAPPSDFRDYVNTIESPMEVRQRLRDTYPVSPVDGTVRMLFIGTSQTWGAGARTEDETFVRRIERALNERAASPERYECINAGISGTDSSDLLRYYREEWIDWDPRVVVINLATNDLRPNVLGRNLAEFLSLNRLRGIRTLLVMEANSPEQERKHLLLNHEAMRHVAAEHPTPIVSMHTYLAGRCDAGFLWWDFVHLTSAGHELVAERILPELVRLMAEADHR
jgi:lysophospholipase L1-like esterase